MSIDVNEGRALYANGSPLPGEVMRHDPGQVDMAGCVAAALPFGRIVGQFTLQASGDKLFAPIDDTSTKSDGVSKYSYDAIALPDDLTYSANEAAVIVNRGFVVVEAYADLSLDNTPLTVVNGEGTTTDSDDIGKVAQATGEGYSVATNIRLVRKFSATLVEIQITGPIVLTPGA